MMAEADEQVFHYGSPRGIWAMSGGALGCLISWGFVYASVVTGTHNGATTTFLLLAPVVTAFTGFYATMWFWSLKEFRAVVITPQRTEIRHLGWHVVVDNAHPGLRIQCVYGGVWIGPPEAATVLSRGFGRSFVRDGRVWVPFLTTFCLQPNRVIEALNRIAP